MGQRLRIYLQIQGTWVRSQVQEDSTCLEANKPVCLNYWAHTLGSASHNYWAYILQLLKPGCLESVLHNKRSQHNEKPKHHKEK